MLNRIISIVLISLSLSLSAQEGSYQIAVLKYNGGGDWYANLETSLPNLIQFVNQEIDMNVQTEQAIVEASTTDLFDYPFVHMTGHGNVVFSDEEAENLRTYLNGGGFLHIDDNYGMDPFIRQQIKKVFPNETLVEIPFDHPIYHQKFDFSNGLPKVHEHDGKAPQGLGIIIEGRVALFYSYEADLGDGWEDQEIHQDSEATRKKALQMGANIISYAFSGE